MVYLNEIRNKLIDSASERDLALYRFLNKQQFYMSVLSNDTESELCSRVFSGNNADEILCKIRNVKPFKGLHYSNNFVLLIAAAKVDINGEEANIVKYLSNHSNKEQFIINCALDKNYNIAKNLGNPINRLVEKIEKNEEISKIDIQSCLSSIMDLYDLFILEKAISIIIFQLSESKNVSCYESLFIIQKKVFRRIEYFFYLILFSIFSYALYFIVPMFIGLIVEHWDILEPIAYIVDKVVMFFILITGVMLTYKVELIKNKVKKISLIIFYKLLGISYVDYIKLSDKIKNK